MIRLIIGIILIVIQILSYVGNLAFGGVQFFSSFSIYEFLYFFGYNIVGIIGIVFLFVGIHNIKKTRRHQNKFENSSRTQRDSIFYKIYSLGASHKKALIITTTLCLIMFFSSLILYNVINVQMINLRKHYFETEKISQSISEYGCGLSSCPYCNGSTVRSSTGIYAIPKYRSTSNARTFFEVLGLVATLLSLLCLSYCIFLFIYRKKLKRNYTY